MKKTFDAIDLTKFIGSVLVFSMHCGALNDFRNEGFILEVIARWSVPFFFICSSYFLFKKSVNGVMEKTVIQHYLIRIASLYAIWLLVNTPNILFTRLYSKDLSKASTWLIFIKNSLLSSSYTGSWYLTSSIFSAFTVYMLYKNYKTKTVLLITFVVYLFCIFSSAYHGLIPTSIAAVLDFLCFPLNIFNGGIYFAIGKYIYENEEKLIYYFSTTKCLIFFFVFYAMVFIEVLCAKYLDVLGMTDVTFSIIGVSFFLFLFCIQIRINIKNAVLLRKISTIIYCSQGNVLLVNGGLRKFLGLSSIVAWLLSAVVVAFICALVLFLQKRNRWEWTKYLT